MEKIKSFVETMKKRGQGGSALKKKRRKMNKFVKLEEVTNSINIMETPLGRDEHEYELELGHKRCPRLT